MSLDERRQRQRERYHANPSGKIRASGAYRLKARSRPEYRQMERACIKRWLKRHPDKARMIRRIARLNRSARKRAAYVESVSPEKVYARDAGICGICKGPVNHSEAWHIDHVIPLAKGGEHSYANVQLAHGLCNSLKRDTMPSPHPPGRNGSSLAFTQAGGDGRRISLGSGSVDG